MFLHQLNTLTEKITVIFVSANVSKCFKIMNKTSDLKRGREGGSEKKRKPGRIIRTGSAPASRLIYLMGVVVHLSCAWPTLAKTTEL